VDEARHVHELDRHSGGQRIRVVGSSQEDEQRAHSLAARGERLSADVRDEPSSCRNGVAEARVELLHVRVEAGSGAD